ncbi:MAG: PsaJ protein [Stenomitos rutilans HA7619-LM2]|jgi:photosystem I subunit 9|nr:PsaJ protein [Stenomitos rutilans HA7619-LM2]
MARQNSQPNFFVRYLSLAPILAVIATSVAISTWAVFNFYFPDLLFHPMP